MNERIHDKIGITIVNDDMTRRMESMREGRSHAAAFVSREEMSSL